MTGPAFAQEKSLLSSTDIRLHARPIWVILFAFILSPSCCIVLEKRDHRATCVILLSMVLWLQLPAWWFFSSFCNDIVMIVKWKRRNSRWFFGRLTTPTRSETTVRRKTAITPALEEPLTGWISVYTRRAKGRSSWQDSLYRFPRETLSSPVSQLVSANAFLSAVWLLRFAILCRVLPR